MPCHLRNKKAARTWTTPESKAGKLTFYPFSTLWKRIIIITIKNNWN